VAADYQRARKCAERAACYEKAEAALIGEENLLRDIRLQSIEEGERCRVQKKSEKHHRTQVRGGAGVPSSWEIARGGQRLQVQVTPDVVSPEGAGAAFGRIAAYVGAPPAMVTVRSGPVDGLWKGVEKTWEVSALTLRMMGRMVIGQASVKNLSGPLTIADYAGKSASLGLTQYLLFLALISVSLGVLNLLPLPVLDGGHLMYYLWEAVTGRSISDAWMERLQRGGVAVLLVMMSIALFNDVARFFG